MAGRTSWPDLTAGRMGAVTYARPPADFIDAWFYWLRCCG